MASLAIGSLCKPSLRGRYGVIKSSSSLGTAGSSALTSNTLLILIWFFIIIIYIRSPTSIFQIGSELVVESGTKLTNLNMTIFKLVQNITSITSIQKKNSYEPTSCSHTDFNGEFRKIIDCDTYSIKYRKNCHFLI